MIYRLKMIVLLHLIVGLLCCRGTNSIISEKDQQILKQFWQYATKHQLANLPVQERIIYIAHFFLDTPYQGNTLNLSQEEHIVINLHALDCVTFVENVLALALLPQYNSSNESVFIENLQNIRYRQGKIEDYCSRLHYSSDWLYELQQRQLLQDMTSTIGGIPFQPNVFFMSKHYDRYPQLQQDSTLVRKIQQIETMINQRSMYYIPKDRIDQISQKIEQGDILLLTTNIKGLDTSHLGFAFKKQGIIYLFHASSTEKKVVISKLPLQEYMAGIRSQTGIMIGRPFSEKHL